jgi:hypothetical protein
MPKDFQTQLDEYRELLSSLEEKMQSEYDKAVMTLSGGALGISLTFLKDIVKQTPLIHPGWLMAAWICWGASVGAVLMSFLTSLNAMRKALRQVELKVIYYEKPGGWLDILTLVLNIMSGGLFLFGVIFIAVFMEQNLK